MLRRIINSRICNFGITKRHFFTLVESDEAVYREYFGKNRVKLDTGIRLNIPKIHSIKRVNMDEHRIYCRNFECSTFDNYLVKICVYFEYKIVDPEYILYTLNDYDSEIRNVCLANLKKIICNHEYECLINGKRMVATKIIENISKTNNVSIRCTGIHLVSIDCLKIGNISPQKCDIPKKTRNKSSWDGPEYSIIAFMMGIMFPIPSLIFWSIVFIMAFFS